MGAVLMQALLPAIGRAWGLLSAFKLLFPSIKFRYCNRSSMNIINPNVVQASSRNLNPKTHSASAAPPLPSSGSAYSNANHAHPHRGAILGQTNINTNYIPAPEFSANPENPNYPVYMSNQHSHASANGGAGGVLSGQQRHNNQYINHGLINNHNHLDQQLYRTMVLMSMQDSSVALLRLQLLHRYLEEQLVGSLLPLQQRQPLAPENDVSLGNNATAVDPHDDARFGGPRAVNSAPTIGSSSTSCNNIGIGMFRTFAAQDDIRVRCSTQGVPPHSTAQNPAQIWDHSKLYNNFPAVPSFNPAVKDGAFCAPNVVDACRESSYLDCGNDVLPSCDYCNFSYEKPPTNPVISSPVCYVNGNAADKPGYFNLQYHQSNQKSIATTS